MEISLYAIIYKIVIIGLIIVFFVSFWLFVNRMISSRRNTEISVKRIEEKLDLIINKITEKN